MKTTKTPLPFLQLESGLRFATTSPKVAKQSTRWSSDADQLVSSLNFVYPLFFRTEDNFFPYYCGGTCFTARYRSQLYILTARHCLEEQKGEPAILGPENRFFPIKQNFSIKRTEPDNRWTDVSVFTTYDTVWTNRRNDSCVDFDKLEIKEIEADYSTFIVVKGYPHLITEIEDPRIIRKAGMHIGFYGGEADESHCHIFDNVSPSIKDPNGLSGSPVLRIDYCQARGFYSTLLGMVVQGGREAQLLRFIGVDILIRIIKHINDAN